MKYLGLAGKVLVLFCVLNAHPALVLSKLDAHVWALARLGWRRQYSSGPVIFLKSRSKRVRPWTLYYKGWLRKAPRLLRSDLQATLRWPLLL